MNAPIFNLSLNLSTLGLCLALLTQSQGFALNVVKFPLVTKNSTRDSLNIILQKAGKDLIPEINTVDLDQDSDFHWERLIYLQGLISAAKGQTYFMNTIESDGCFEGDAKAVAENISKIKAIWLEEEFNMTSYKVPYSGNTLSIQYSDSSAPAKTMIISRCE